MRQQELVNHARRTVATVAVLLLGIVAVPGRADAGVAKGTASGAELLTTAHWAATVSPTPLTFTTIVAQTAAVTNTGTVTLVAISYKVTISNPTSGSPTFTLFACPVAWSSGKCSGGSGTQVGSTFAKSSTTTVNSSVVPAIGGSVFLLATPTAVSSSVSMTLGTSISSSTQLRAHVATNQ
jgi:hypothetical protein